MENLDFHTMQELQKELQKRYQEKWDCLCPKNGRDKLLWMIAEAGEAADVIKKKGDLQIMSDPVVRKHFVEEICDVLMYLNDVMLCYSISPEELSRMYLEKHKKNLKRW